ncbi:hypothetical protein M9H77_06337 [Catharanthus roseus]|uniref:Uncharacterized protein n=1 Tax=Catharanthus roseus TaxID=4058 RepID=A0ACC0BS48_CATRO|nr:hypothetical protein M9H77_06337 [Catharanthus roseus]
MKDLSTRSAYRSVHKLHFIMLFQILQEYLEAVAQLVFTWTSHHALRWDSHLVESQEGLETEVGLKADLICLGRSGAQQATEVLGQEFLDQISPERAYCQKTHRCPTQSQLT